MTPIRRSEKEVEKKKLSYLLCNIYVVKGGSQCVMVNFSLECSVSIETMFSHQIIVVREIIHNCLVE